MTSRTEHSTECLEADEITRRGLWNELLSFAQEDPARHYFILLGLLNPEKTFQSVITLRSRDNQLQAAYFQRTSGNAQLMMSPELLDSKFKPERLSHFAEAIRSLGFNQLIAAASYCRRLEPFGLFVSHFIGAEISVMSSETAAAESLKKEITYDLESLQLDDLDEIIDLYQRCFHSFTPRPIMEEKLLTGRGHGVLVREKGRIVSCAQSEFESPRQALIVGVATEPEARHRGIASACVAGLVNSLATPDRSFALQYDNPSAGRIYKRLGFIPADHVGHYHFRKEQ